MPGSIPGRACGPNRSEFSVIFSETFIHMGQVSLETPPWRALSPRPRSHMQTTGLNPTILQQPQNFDWFNVFVTYTLSLSVHTHTHIYILETALRISIKVMGDFLKYLSFELSDFNEKSLIKEFLLKQKYYHLIMVLFLKIFLGLVNSYENFKCVPILRN